jgi:hypothetical protein
MKLCKMHFVLKALISAYLRMGTAAFAANASKPCNAAIGEREITRPIMWEKVVSE